MQFNKAMYAKAFGNNKGKRVFPIRVGMQICCISDLKNELKIAYK